nr:nitroreductase family protein [Chloroflexota bacterium]
MAKKNHLQIFRARRTIRRFTPEAVSEEYLQSLLEAGSVAPSRLDRRPLHYVLIRNNDTKTKIAEALRVRPYIEEAPLVIAVCANPEISDTWEMDGSAAIENMLLAATTLGLGGAWVGSKGSALWDQTVQVLRQTTGIPANIEVVSLVCFGHPAEEKRAYEPGEKMDRQRVHYEHWNNLKL